MKNTKEHFRAKEHKVRSSHWGTRRKNRGVNAKSSVIKTDKFSALERDMNYQTEEARQVLNRINKYESILRYITKKLQTIRHKL